MAAEDVPPLVFGYETRTCAALSAELISRATEAMQFAALRVEERLRASAAPYTDTGEMADSIRVEVIGGFGGFGARELGLIASCHAPQGTYLDKGTGRGGTGIRRPSGKKMPVGQRSPDRRNAPAEFRGQVTPRVVVRGIMATGWFSRPDGIPLNEVMRNSYASRFRRTR